MGVRSPGGNRISLVPEFWCIGRLVEIRSVSRGRRTRMRIQVEEDVRE